MKSTPSDVKALLSAQRSNPEGLCSGLAGVEKHFGLRKEVCEDDVLRPRDEDLEPDGPGEVAATTARLVERLAAEHDCPEKVSHYLQSFGVELSFSETLGDVVGRVVRRQSCHASVQRFTRCDWSLDVALSSSRMLKLLEPAVSLEIATNDATNSVRLELTAREFGRLRCQVAEALKMLYAVEKKKPFAV